VTYNPSLHTELPVCATPEIVALNVNGKIPQAAAAVDCQQRVATTLESITRACGYAKDCTCELVIPPSATPPSIAMSATSPVFRTRSTARVRTSIPLASYSAS